MIVTHQNLDLDAITGCWLLQRYGGFNSEEVRFVNTGNPDRELLAQANAVVDTGKEYDPKVWRFDHHQLSGQASNETCAAKQIYEWLRDGIQMPEMDHLQPLIDLVFAGDTGRPEANHSRELGLHSLLWGYKQAYKEEHGVFVPDDIILTWGYQMLDLLDLKLRKQAEAKAELSEKVVYKSNDGLVWGIRHGSTGSGFAAFEEGARLVVFEGEPIEDGQGNIISYPIGIQRAAEWLEPHVGELVWQMVDYLTDYKPRFDYFDVLADELKGWFKHNGGFFSGRGTGKAPDPRPIVVELEVIARLVDVVWER